MTSNAEEQANQPAGAPVQPSKATKRANVTPQKRRVAPGRPRSGKGGHSRQQAAQKPKGRQTSQACRWCPRGQQGSQGLGPAEATGRRFAEGADESYRLVDSVRGYLSGAVARRMGLKLVSAKSEDGERRYTVQR
jgi:hypothetical protein